MTPQAAAAAWIRLYGRRVLACVSACCAAWMVMLAARYFGLSAEDMAGGLGIGADHGSWFATAYAAGEPVGVAVGCWLAIGLSIRRVLLPATALFMAAALLPALLPAFPVMLACRALAGLAAGAIMPLSILTQLRVFNLTWRPLAIAIYAGSATMGPQLAGSLDAWAVARYGWTAILWASLLPGAVALLAGAAGLWREKIRWRIFIHADLAGLIALCAGLVLLAVGVSQGNRLHWSDSPAILALLAGGAACLGLFALHERRHLRHPAVSLRLARRWNFTLGALATLPLQLASACSGALVPELLARLQGFRPEQIAPVLTAALWPQLLAYPFGVLALRYRLADARTLLVLGLCCVALGCVCDLSVTSDWMAADFAAGQWLQGLGLPLIILPLLVLFVGEVIPSEGVYAASIFNVSRSLAGTAVGAWMATSLRLGGQAKYADLLANTGLYPLGHRGALAATAAVVAHAGADPGQTHLRAVRLIAIAARRQAAVLAGSAMFADLAAALFVSCCLALLMAGFGHGHPDRRKAGR